MLIDVQDGRQSWIDVYRLCISFINPRPIALVSTLSPEAAANLAPFSFYNMVSGNPPVVMICTASRRDRSPKDTQRNIEATREFAIATVTSDIARKMADCGAELPYGASEFAFSGLTPTPATRIRPSLVAEAKVNLECRLRQVVRFSDAPSAASVIFGDVLMIHVADDVLDDSGAACDPRKLQTVGRLGGAWYANVENPYEMRIPDPPPQRSGPVNG